MCLQLHVYTFYEHRWNQVSDTGISDSLVVNAGQEYKTAENVLFYKSLVNTGLFY